MHSGNRSNNLTYTLTNTERGYKIEKICNSKEAPNKEHIRNKNLAGPDKKLLKHQLLYDRADRRLRKHIKVTHQADFVRLIHED